MIWFYGLLFILDSLPWSDCYNLDTDHPIIIENPDPTQEGTYFGYSLVLYGDRENKWIKVGMPKATYNGRAGLVQRSGVVYHCPFLIEACQIDENINYSSRNNMTNSWIGGAMDINYKYKTVGISAERWRNADSVIVNIPGAILIENFEKENVYMQHSPLKDPLIYQKMPYYARALAGFSLHFLQDQSEILVGAPGVYNYLGTVFRIKDVDKNQEDWTYDVIAPSGNYYQYSGYAVTSGCFYKKGEMHYVTGLPRGFDKQKRDILDQVPYGGVFLLTFKSPYKLNRLKEIDTIYKDAIYGTQVWEYFGSALAAGDLNGDGLDDLIVGAPFRRNEKTGFNHGSVYVYYGNNRKLQYDPKNRIDGLESGGQFGAALMVLGDLDKDGLCDLAISAPNEKGSGTVYIYSFDNIMKILKVSQKIRGKDISSNLKGFGTSFSRAKDIDDNDFADLAVGSPLSGHAVILRSKPTVSVYTNIEVPSSISKSNSSLFFTCCYAFTGYPYPTLTLSRNLTVDRDFNRFYFNNHVYRQNSEQKQIVIDQNGKFCEHINVTKISYQNYNDPISITLTYKIPEDQSVNKKSPVIITRNNITSRDSFCKTCPLLSKNSKTSETKLVIWDHNCNHEGRKEPCKSKLEVNAKFLNLSQENTATIGATELLTLEIQIVNKGDPAFSPLLQIALPNGVSLSMGPEDCQNNGANNITCDAGEVLHDKLTYYLILNINENEVNDLRFFFNASTITENVNDKSTFYLDLKLKREADFLIIGYSKESSYVYEKGKPTLIRNTFKIEKFGPSPTLPAQIGIIIPYKTKGSNGSYVQFAKIVDRNQTSSENPLIKCDENIEDFKERNRRQAEDESLKVLNLDCSMGNITCAHLKCRIGSLDSLQNYAEVLVDMEVDFQKLDKVMGNEWLMEIDQILVVTGAFISTDDFIQTGNRSDFTELSNVVSVNKDLHISLWILIGSVIVGLIILICVTIALAKAGFFERKEHKMLLQLKEEALEEKILEEMIQKEQETGHGFPGEGGDLVFRYIKPHELERYWNHLEEPLEKHPLVENDTKEPARKSKS